MSRAHTLSCPASDATRHGERRTCGAVVLTKGISMHANAVVPSPESPAPAAPASRRAMRQARTIQGALPIVARSIGRQLNVEVQIGGSEAKTDGRVITLPTLPFDDPEVETLAFGFLEHEAAHIRYTDDVETKNALHHRLCNTIEDIRIERELGREFPGFAANLGRLVTKLVQTGVMQRPAEQDPPAIKLRRYLSYRLRAEVLEQGGLTEYAQRAEEIFRAAYPSGVGVRLGSVIGRVPTLRSTQEAADLAHEILEILEDESQEPPPPPPPPPPEEAGSQGAAVDAQECGSASARSESADAEAPARAMLRGMLSAPESALGDELSEVLGEALKGAAAQAVQARGGRSGGFGRADAPLRPPPGNGPAILDRVHEASTALRTRLRSQVESVRHSRRTYSRHGTRFASQRAVRALLGDARLFAKKRLGREVNTAIVLLCDRSSSMGGRPIEIASDCVLAAASGLSAIRGVALEAAVFPGCTAEVEVLTSFAESLRATATRYPAVEASGGTPMYEALMWGFERLLMRKEPRKILVCLTDGEPPESTAKACSDAIRAAMRGGLEVYGIGIEVPDISKLFPVCQSISNLSELAPILFRFLKEAMTGRASH
ncbi:MAG: VWA domain-containing protein [Steroidobacteraceae bacterium]